MLARFVAVVLATSIVASCAGGDEQPPVQASKDAAAALGRRAPNVLLIITDDQREGLNVMPKTRRLFVNGGVRFNNAFATTPLCCPSRATILTGQYVHRHGVKRNYIGNKAEGLRMIQERLHTKGYRTGYFGKFFNYWDITKRPPGADRWALVYSGVYYNGTWNVNGTMRTIPTYSTTYLGRRGSAFLELTERRDRQPWMMVVSTTAPHGAITPRHAPATAESRYADAPVPPWSGNAATRDRNLSDKPAYVREQGDWFGDPRGIREGQLRSLMSVDDMIGKIFRKMRDLSENRRTLAIFISDNGLLWGEFGMTGKSHAYTPSIKVPLLMRWPGHVKRGTGDPRLVANVDVTPTILDAVGLPLKGVDGHSLLKDERRGRLLLEYWRANPPTPRWRSLRTKRYQYIEYYKKDDVSFREYFRLRRDPWQTHNVLRDGRRGNDPNVWRLSRALRLLADCVGERCP